MSSQSTSRRHEWLASPNVSWRWAAAASFFWFVVIYTLSRSSVGPYLETKLARPLDFRVRDLWGQSPSLDSRLKIFSVDDKTFARLGNWTPSLKTWATLIKAIAAREPKAIVVDGMFSKADNDDGEATFFLEELKDLRVPLITGSFVAPRPVQFRDGLDAKNPNFDLRAMLPAGMDPVSDAAKDLMPTLADRYFWYAYGPDPMLTPVLKNIGHFIYEGDSRSAPLLRMLDDKVIPHLSLLVASERKFEQGRLIVDGATVPLDGEGQVVVNFPSPDTWRQANMSILSSISKARGGRPLTSISKGDVVLILPLMFTGNTDFRTTPFGTFPGGYVVTSLINSVMTKNWLKPLSADEVLFACAAAAGAALAIKAGVLGFWFGLLFLAFAGIAASLYGFAFHGIVASWLMTLLTFSGTALTVFAEKTRVGEKKAQRLRNALEGAVAPDELQSILKNPELVSLDARERVVTLMFIDVVGFSLLAENMLPRIAFDNLKNLLAQIGETVHQYGGIIDKTLGDGLLCYFGYRFDKDQSTPDHAEKALRCAMTIQKQNLRRNIEAAKINEPIYPLRVGVNTSSCYLGDLGSGDRIDFTVVGNGVNFTKRLEGACEMHSVLYGATTQDMVKSIGLPALAVSKRFIRIKHHSELVEAYEYDPFYAEPELRRVAVEAFRKCANIERIDHRWPVHDATRIQLESDFGAGQLVNFSHTGFSIKLRQALVKGTYMSLKIDAGGGALRSLLAQVGIDELRGEVRWSYNEGSEFVHGVMLSGITETQGDALVQYLCEFAFTRVDEAAEEKEMKYNAS
jgi:class 3 adenylate cyclase